MTELVPNVGADELGMTVLDTEHLQSLQHSIGGRGVVSGVAPSASGGSLNVTYTSGVVASSTFPNATVTGSTVPILTGVGIGSGNARRDLIVADIETGVVSAIAGPVSAYNSATGAIPDLPVIPDDQVLIATYFMKEGENTAAANRLTDCRTFVTTTDVADSPPAAAPLDPTADTVLTIQSGGLVLAGLQDVRPSAFEQMMPQDGSVELFEFWTGFSTATTADATHIPGTLATTALSGTSAQVTNGVATTFTPCLQVSTGTTTTGRCAAFMQSYPILFVNTSAYRFASRTMITTVSTAGQQHEIRFGLINSWTAAPADGFYFRAQHGDTNWEAVSIRSAATSGSTVTDTGIAQSTSWVVLDIEYNGTVCIFRIDGTQVASHTTHIPASAVHTLQPGLGIFKAAGTTARNTRSDWWFMKVGDGDHGTDLLL
jgi:hypothetical protein